MKRYKLLIIVMVGVILTGGGLLIATQMNKSQYFCEPVLTAEGCKNPSLRHTSKPDYTMASAYNLPGTGTYACSKSIKMVSYTVDKNGEYQDYYPVDSNEASLFCHMTSAEEFKGKLKVLQKPEVLQLISKYSYKDMSIKALEFKYIKDADYVHRLLPDYKDRKIGCIIVLFTPGEKKVYLEDENLNTFEELSYKEFAQHLEQISPADKKLFYDNLR